jgi:hypothetical protein
MIILPFEDYLSNGIVKRQRSNIQRTNSLIKEAQEKKEFLELTIKTTKPEESYPNFIIDYCYDILMELIRAKMFKEGYNVGNSHEAEVSYLKILGFNESDIKFMDELRYNRNGIKYYGSTFSKEYAQKVLAFLNKIYPKLLELIG